VGIRCADHATPSIRKSWNFEFYIQWNIVYCSFPTKMSMYCGLESTLIGNKFYHLCAWSHIIPNISQELSIFMFLLITWRTGYICIIFLITKFLDVVYRLPNLDKVHCVIVQRIRLNLSQRSGLLTALFSIILLCIY
jgi:hypothetical protein